MFCWHSFTCFRVWHWKWNSCQLLITKGKWTSTLNFGPTRWSALNMGFVDKWPSRLQGQFVLLELGRLARLLVEIQKINNLAGLSRGAGSRAQPWHPFPHDEVMAWSTEAHANVMNFSPNPLQLIAHPHLLVRATSERWVLALFTSNGSYSLNQL